jgi:murein DD-endopeptidase MepM/ murein hydrolase activator NlpD
VNDESNNLAKDLKQFIGEFGQYWGFRIRQMSLFSYAGVEVFLGFFYDLKALIVSKMFWGRGSFYRTSFHIFISILSGFILFSGLSTKLNVFGETANGLGVNDSTLGGEDLFSQSGTSESVGIIEEDQYDYVVHKYVVKKGDTLSSIAQLYSTATQKMSINTLIWANNLANANVALVIGQVLRVPEIDGAFYKVKKGDTLAKIATATKSEIPDILDYNRKVLDSENPVLTEGLELFIVGGQIIAPVVKPVYKTYSVSSGSVPTGSGYDIPRGTFINPLTNCSGYSYSRGFKPTHGGVDLAKHGGCWINAAAPGVVTRAGWGTTGEGYYVVIEHGNGLKTRYYHGEKRFAVKVGDNVKAGQPILYMGSTGNSTGTHLHFEIVINNKRVNPELYVKVR